MFAVGLSVAHAGILTDTAAPGGHAVKEVYRRAIAAETRVIIGGVQVQSLWDLKGFFDGITVPVLIPGADSTGFR